MSLAITSFEFDQPVYTPGQMITLTVNYTSTDTNGALGNVSHSVTVTVSDTVSTTNASSGNPPNFPAFVVNEGTPAPLPTTVAVTDSRTPPGAWTLVSNTLSATAPYTGVAVLTSVA